MVRWGFVAEREDGQVADRATGRDAARHDGECRFDDFVATASPRFLALARLLTGDPDRAEDLVQDAFAKAYLRWDRIDDPGGYVRRCVVNAHTDWWRRRPWREQPTAELPDQAGPRDAFAQWADGADLMAALALLTRRERAVITLRYYEDLSEAQIAAVLGIAPGTVKSAASRALAKLRTSPHLNEVSP